MADNAAVTPTTADTLAADHTRVAGPNRFATAVAIADQLWPVDPAGYVIAPGGTDDGWAYALPAASLAADTDQPILLTELDRLPTETDQATCQTGTHAPTADHPDDRHRPRHPRHTRHRLLTDPRLGRTGAPRS